MCKMKRFNRDNMPKQSFQTCYIPPYRYKPPPRTSASHTLLTIVTLPRFTICVPDNSPVYSYIRLLPDNHPPQPLQHNILQQLYTAPPPSPLVTLQPHRIQINHQFLHAATVTIPPLPPCLISSCHPVPPRRDRHHSTITTLPNFKLSSSSSTPRPSPFHHYHPA